MKQCSLPGCDDPFLAQELCAVHYRKAKWRGDLLVRGEAKICSVDGCGNHVICKGWCNTHYRRMRKSGTLSKIKQFKRDLVVFDRRTCTRCGAEKPLDQFPLDSSCLLGRQPRCKKCTSEYQRARRRADPVAYNARYRAWRRDNIERRRAVARASQHRRYWADPDASRACMRENARRWLSNNRELVRQRKNSYSLASREAIRERRRIQYLQSPDRFRRYSRTSGRVRRARLAASLIVPFTQSQLDARMAYWGNRCYMCGGPFEAVEHVKPLAKGGPHALMGLRPACKPCNSRKGTKWQGPAWAMELIDSRLRGDDAALAV